MPVLLYHQVTPARFQQGGLNVAPGRFETHVRRLSRWGYTGITAATWAGHLDRGEPLPRKPVVITFDDGYAALADYAFPVLRRYGFAATIYIVTRRLGQANT
jgi:peptidoglycan/xylan/chitin deacetylase (PgdA/CDA1 family)